MKNYNNYAYHASHVAYTTRASAFRGSTTHYALLREEKGGRGEGRTDFTINMNERARIMNIFRYPASFYIETRTGFAIRFPLLKLVIDLRILFPINTSNVMRKVRGSWSEIEGIIGEDAREDARKKKKKRIPISSWPLRSSSVSCRGPSCIVSASVSPDRRASA